MWVKVSAALSKIWAQHPAELSGLVALHLIIGPIALPRKPITGFNTHAVGNGSPNKGGIFPTRAKILSFGSLVFCNTVSHSSRPSSSRYTLHGSDRLVDMAITGNRKGARVSLILPKPCKEENNKNYRNAILPSLYHHQSCHIAVCLPEESVTLNENSPAFHVPEEISIIREVPPPFILLCLIQATLANGKKMPILCHNFYLRLNCSVSWTKLQ